MIRQFLTWHSPSGALPDQGRAIVWKGLHGETVEGCVSYILKRKVFGPPQMIASWLPLRDDKFHVADEPIKYLPSLWRYKDGGESRDNIERSIFTYHGGDKDSVSQLSDALV